jgi:hypothetical protein
MNIYFISEYLTHSKCLINTLSFQDNKYFSNTFQSIESNKIQWSQKSLAKMLKLILLYT